jgi:non-specific serine/threonine protein kinase
VDSPQLVRDQVDQTPGPSTAGQWQVPVIEFDADAAVETVAALDPDRASPATSVVHLAELGRFAADLVGRGRLLPGVDLDPPRATWRPVLTGPDAAWSRALAQSLPPSLVAADPDQPLVVWADALDSLVDAAARTAAGRVRLAGGRGGDPVTRAWLGALTGPERRFTATAADAAALAGALSSWQGDVLTGPVRACFRLVEPPETDPDRVWKVRLALQATDEPSLVVDAAQVWRARGPLPALARYLDSPQETLLAELGKARRVYPGLDAALRAARPTVLTLDTTAAHSFLQVAAPALATAGFGVQLPGWWTKPSSRLGVRITASTPSQPGAVAGSGAAVGFAAIAEFRHDLAVGGEVLTAAELAELSAAKAPLVRLRGQWIELDAGRLAAGLRVVGRTGTATVGELLRLGLQAGADQSIDGLPVESVQAAGWLGDLLSGDTEQRLTPVDVADSFAGRLRPYQARGLAWLDFMDRAGLGALLADDMGLGKTVQLLALLAQDAASGRSGPSLLVCPMSLVGNWQREAARFTPSLRVHVHHGAERARGKEFADAVAAGDLIVTT